MFLSDWFIAFVNNVIIITVYTKNKQRIKKSREGGRRNLFSMHTIQIFAEFNEETEALEFSKTDTLETLKNNVEILFGIEEGFSLFIEGVELVELPLLNTNDVLLVEYIQTIRGKSYVCDETGDAIHFSSCDNERCFKTENTIGHPSVIEVLKDVSFERLRYIGFYDGRPDNKIVFNSNGGCTTVKSLEGQEFNICQSSSTIWGLSFLQAGIVGLASYHFEEGEPYISYSAALPSWKLDDGSPLPIKKYFSNFSFDEDTRVFTGTINWPIPFTGMKVWQYDMKFNETMMLIESGTVKCDNGHNWVFGVTLKYLRNLKMN